MTRWLRRRGLIVLVAVVVAAFVAAVGLSPGAASYKATAELVVPTGATALGPGAANEANSLAVTYAQLIPQDDAAVTQAASDLRISLRDARDDLSVSVVGTTSLLDLSFTASQADQAYLGLSDVVTALLKGSRSVPTGSLSVVAAPSTDSVSRSGGLSLSDRVLGGAGVGLLLGLLIAWAWSRRDRRVDTPDDLRRVLETPVSQVDKGTEWELRPLMSRWKERAGVARPVVGLVFPPETDRDLESVTSRMFSSVRGAPLSVTRWRRVPDDPTEAAKAPGDRLLIGGEVGTDEAAAVALVADWVVLAVPAGTREATVVAAVDGLRQQDVAVGWGLVIRPPAARGARQPRSAATVAEPDEPSEAGEPAAALERKRPRPGNDRSHVRAVKSRRYEEHYEPAAGNAGRETVVASHEEAVGQD